MMLLRCYGKTDGKRCEGRTDSFYCDSCYARIRERRERYREQERARERAWSRARREEWVRARTARESDEGQWFASEEPHR